MSQFDILSEEEQKAVLKTALIYGDSLNGEDFLTLVNTYVYAWKSSKPFERYYGELKSMQAKPSYGKDITAFRDFYKETVRPIYTVDDKTDFDLISNTVEGLCSKIELWYKEAVDVVKNNYNI